MATHGLLALLLTHTLLTHALLIHVAPQTEAQQTEVPYYDFFNYDYTADIEAQEAMLAEATEPPRPLPPRDPLADGHVNESPFYLSPSSDCNTTSAREMAKLNIMDRILIALGPPFGEKLPKLPTIDTLATVQTPINITTEPCPYKYKRCSSQAFFPSCNIPRNTAAEIWPQMFNLYFNVSEKFDNQLDIINSTLRLYKNTSLPIPGMTKLSIKAHVYTRSLTRRRNRTKLLAETQVTSDYIGWVTLSVTDIVKRWKRHKNNHGVKITVEDESDRPWDAPSIFVTMDCASGILPLPFEVQTEEERQQYPALNVRLGSPDDESEKIMTSSSYFSSSPRALVAPTYRPALPSPSPTMQGDDPVPLYDYNYENDLQEEENKEREIEEREVTSEGEVVVTERPFHSVYDLLEVVTQGPTAAYYRRHHHHHRTPSPTPSPTPMTPTTLPPLREHTTPVPSPTSLVARSRGSYRRRGAARDMRHRRRHRGGHRKN